MAKLYVEDDDEPLKTRGIGQFLLIESADIPTPNLHLFY